MQSSGCKDRVLKVRTADLYHSLLRNHLLPAFRDVRLNDIDEAAIRRWRKERLDTGSRGQRRFGPITVAKAYRLLHAIFETAVADQMVRRNPCRIEGAGKEDSPEREVVSLPVVFAIADALPVRYRAMALLATFVSMRWGELVGLRRENIDLGACEIRIVETTAELDRGELLPETPKSRAGRRTVTFPAELVPELHWHLERFAQPGERGLVFAGPKGAMLRRSNFRPIWNAACDQAGMPSLHFHDLRHVGGTLAAATGASLKELMARLGHSSTRAAMIYQHATRDRDQAIAKALGGLVQQVRLTTAIRPEEASGDE
jgi:integrase